MTDTGRSRYRAFRALTFLQNDRKNVRKPDRILTYNKGHTGRKMLNNVKTTAHDRHTDASLKGRRATTTSLSDCPYNPMTGVCSEQAYGETHHRIGRALREPVVGKQCVVLLHERGEGGETAAEAGSEEHAQIAVHNTSTLEQAIEQAYEETAENIDNHRPPGETRSDVGLYHVREQVAGHSADETSRTYKQNYS